MSEYANDISVIICAYTEERWDDLVAAVDSVRGQTLPPLETIVVIDHNPALQERAAMTLSRVVVVENMGTSGLSGARNSGIAKARGSIVAFMDDDAVAEPDWLERLQAGFSDPNALGVGGTVQPLWANGRPGWFPREFDWVVGCTYAGMPTTQARVRNLIGCNMAFRSSALLIAGGFSASSGRVGSYPAGCEETELCIRVQRRTPKGYMLFDPLARVNHRVPSKRATWEYFRRRCYAEGISKAVVSRMVGIGAGLGSERRYLTRTLTKAVSLGIVETFRRASAAELKRAAATVAGVGFTTAGYLRGRISLSTEGRHGNAHQRTREWSTIDLPGS